jgi:nascent polypeptide-associated complex subunit alpha
MFPGMNQRQMQQMMRKMGMQQTEIDAAEVIIRTNDGKEMVFYQPQVAMVNMMGQKTFQLVGEYDEREINQKVELSEEDIQTVIDQTGVSKEIAEEKLSANDGDIAQTIMDLTEQ